MKKSYLLAAPVSPGQAGFWGEGAPYSTESLYHFEAKGPPVNYDAHTLKPHSICHIDFPAHILEKGDACEHYFKNSTLPHFVGEVAVLRLRDIKPKSCETRDGVVVVTVTQKALQRALTSVLSTEDPLLWPPRVFITLDQVDSSVCEPHHHKLVLVLSAEAAEWLVTTVPLLSFGTSWISSDYQPTSRERPVHKLLMRSAVIYECLDLREVPEGRYWLVGVPLRLEGASESPVTPVLFER